MREDLHYGQTLALLSTKKTNIQQNARFFCIEGDYVFVIGYRDWKIAVYKRTNGSLVDFVPPIYQPWRGTDWASDSIALTAKRIGRGEYMIFAARDGSPKVVMYKWVNRVTV